MANEEHVRRLKEEGVEAWNQWRKDNPELGPDLSEADLRGAYLIESVLSRSQSFFQREGVYPYPRNRRPLVIYVKPIDTRLMFFGIVQPLSCAKS